MSMVSEEKDIILLNNQTDRIASTLSSLNSSEGLFKTEYADFKIPINKIKTINFATELLEEIEEDGQKFAFDFYNQAYITGAPISSTEHTITLQTNHSGQVTIPIGEIRSITLQGVSSLIESWSNKH